MDEREEAWEEEIVDVTLGCDDVRAAHTGLDRGGGDQKKARKRHENYCTFDLQRLNA